MGTHEDLVRWLFDAVWSQGRTDGLDEAIGDVAFHYAGVARATDGRALRELVDAYRLGFPDLRFDVQDLVTEDDRVAARLRLRGTHRGTWRGIPATGRSVDIDVMMMFRFEGDRLVEVWEVDDALRLDRQLGLA